MASHSRSLLMLVGFLFPLLAEAHDGPDPLLAYSVKARFLRDDGTLKAQRGPDMDLGQGARETENGLFLDGSGPTPWVKVSPEALPTRSFTLAAWCSIHQPREYGGIIGALEDTGDFEKGWVLGYDQTHFTVGLATAGADDGNGAMTYLRSRTAYEHGRLYHVVATYDGSELALYLNGKLEATTGAQSGAVLYPAGVRLALGGYRDSNENWPHRGQLISANVFGDAAKPEWVAQEFAHNAVWVEVPVPAGLRAPLELVVAPYLQFGTTDGITVMWETNEIASGSVFYGETAACPVRLPAADDARIHEIRIGGLDPGKQYFYKTVSSAGNEHLESEVRTFQTDAGPGAAFAFAVISDTQGNPKVSGTFAKMAWEHRPNFLLHPGDLVSTGGKKQEWVEEFFGSMEPLISRVPFYPVLGNHEQNADHYYNYVSVPDPEYYYTYHYGNAQFFMVDTNKKCDPDSEQYRWLAGALAGSNSEWKFVCHHHPPYSSDENDYGNLWKSNQGARGDTNARHLTALYDAHGVDIVWNGHIHSYERTWPIRGGAVAGEDAPRYMITGGGGGPLETPGPFRNPFELLVRRGHHYAMVWINGRRLEFKAYGLDGVLFDSVVIDKN